MKMCIFERSMQRVLPYLFLAGLVLKVLHLPYHTVLLLVVVLLGLVCGVVGLFRSAQKAPALAVVAAWAWALHLVSVLKLFPFRTVTLGIAVALTLVALALHLRARQGSRPLTVLVCTGLLVLLVMSVPVPQRFLFTNLAFSVERDSDVWSWDKYSFLLLQHGEQEAALVANEKARAIASSTGQQDLMKPLFARREAILSGEWSGYGPLPH